MENIRQNIADRVRQAFVDLGIVRDFYGHRDKYLQHYSIIANYLLSVPGTDEYKFVRELVSVMKLRGCVFINPAICANRARMEEASDRLEKNAALSPDTLVKECRRRVSVYISGGTCATVRNALLSPVTGLPAWFRLVESGFDPEVSELYLDAANEELAHDRELSEYIRNRFPKFRETNTWNH